MDNWMIRTIRNRAMDDPNRTVMIDARTGQRMDYIGLCRAIEDAKELLKRKGVKAGDRIVLMMENSFEFAVMFWAITALRAIVIPVNTGLKGRELQFIVDDVAAGGVIMDEDIWENIKSTPLFSAVGEEGRISLIAIENPLTMMFIKCKGGDSDLDDRTAMLMYTSGTTGNPKGVVLSYENLWTKTRDIIKAHQLTEKDRVLCVLPWFHINGLVITLLTSLAVGEELVIGGRFSVSHFWEYVSRYQATWFSGVPTMYSHLLAKGIPDKRVAKSLRFARSASSALPAAVKNEFEERTGVPIIESYGITEGCAQITTNPLPPRARKLNSVGLPYGNEIKVMKDCGEEAGAGECGEVWIKGDNITSGYYHRPEENRKSFTEGWFHSGDVGYLDEDGYLFLNGRIKELINRAGEKFSPLEIDEVLYQLPEVELAAAVGVPDPVYGEEVVCFIKTKPGLMLTGDTVQRWCSEYLAPYKVPREVLFTEEMPQGGNGKIQRRKLAERYGQRKWNGQTG